MNSELKTYIEQHILPIYQGFDTAHRRDHADKVIRESLVLAKDYDVNEDMVYAIAAYHDTGLTKDRKTHHLVSGQIVRADMNLRQWFDEEQIETMAQAVEDHRASADHAPRSIYGRIVAEADRNIDPLVILTRTVQYGLSHYPELNKAGHIERTLQHLDEKYSPHGYLKLWIPGSKNEQKLHELWSMMEDSERLKGMIEDIYNKEKGDGDPHDQEKHAYLHPS